MPIEVLTLLVGAVFWGVAATFAFVGVAYFGNSARYAFPVLSAFALLLFIGLSLWFPPRRMVAVSLVSILAGSIIGVMALAAYLAPAYAAPPRLSPDQTPATITRLDWQVGDNVRLLGYSLSDDRVSPGDAVDVTLYWETLAAIDQDYSVFLHLLGPDFQMWGSVDSFPGMGAYPTRAWRAGEVIVDAYRLQVAPTAATPSAAWLETGMYDFATGTRLPVSDQNGNPIDVPIFARLGIAGSPTSPPAVQHPATAVFANQIQLLGMDGPDGMNSDSTVVVAPGSELRFALYWQAVSAPENDYSRFAHLVSSDGSLISQQDMLLSSGYPTGLWVAGDWTEDQVTIVMPGEIPPGNYRLIAGLYDPLSQQRLTLPTGDNDFALFEVKVE
jgi:hypothetical protein